MIDHLRALAVFARAVEHGSFRAAARLLGLSPSVVSHHVAQLEAHLGVSLLHRSTRRLALTPDGELLLEAAREMVQAAERGLDTAGARGTPVGHLRVAAPAVLAETPLCADLAAFSHMYPQVRLTLSFSERRADLLRDGLDLALRVGHLADSALRARRLTTMPRVLVASPTYARARPAPRAPADLTSWDLVHLSARAPELALSHGLGEAPVTVTLAPRLTADSARAILGLVLAGAGVASVPELLARDALRAGHLVHVLPAWSLADVAVYAVWPETTQRPSLTLRFVDFIEPRLAALMGRAPAAPRDEPRARASHPRRAPAK